MTLLTWVAATVLGPGALALFVWFLCDLKSLLRKDATDEP